MTILNVQTRYYVNILYIGVEGRYVSALFSAGSESKKLDEIEKSLLSVQAALVKPAVQDFIDSSMVSAKDKAKLMLDIGKETGNLPDTIE